MRPLPPAIFKDIGDNRFIPDHDLWQWCIDNFLNPDSSIFNDDHSHLADARIGFIWTNQPNASKGRRIIGQAEQCIFRCGAWQKGRQEQQIAEWFGIAPDFLITLDANYCEVCSDTDFMMLVEHELYHCSQAIDQYGMPKFNKDTGEASYAMRGHDVEEFVGVVRRYGVGDPESTLAKLIEAAQKMPLIDGYTIAQCCGSCI